MARIRNTFRPNIPGGGYEKEITLDNGEKYIIRNTFTPNIPGDGYEQEIVKINDSYTSNNYKKKNKEILKELAITLIMGLGAIAGFAGIPFLALTCSSSTLGFVSIIVAGLFALLVLVKTAGILIDRFF